MADDPWDGQDLSAMLEVLRRYTRKTPYASRRLPKGMEQRVRRYSQDIGLVLWGWNRVHSHMFEIFWYVLAGNANPAKGRALAASLWGQIQNDSTQRGMLMDMARVQLQENPEALHRLEWLFTAVSLLGRYRNLAAHTYAVFSPHLRRHPTAEAMSTEPVAYIRFEAIDHRRFWKVLAGDLNILGHYALRISRPLFGYREPWPARPRLQSLPLIAKIEGEIGRQRQREQPKPRKKGKNAKRKSAKK